MSLASLTSTSTIVIERVTTTRDTIGGRTQSWAPHLKLSARVQPMNGSENVRYGRDVEATLVNMYTIGAPDVTHRDRVLFKGSYYKILAVRNTDHLDRFLKLICELQQ